MYYTRWGGNTFYFGPDKDKAELQFYDPEGKHAGALVHWQHLRLRSSAAIKTRNRTNHSRVVDVVEQYLISLEGQAKSDWTLKHNRNHLRRFTNTFGDMYTHELSGEMLEAFGMDLRRLGLAPKTIRHDIVAVKACLTHGARRRKVPPEVGAEMLLLVPPTVPTKDPIVHTMFDIALAIAKAHERNARLGISLELQFLTICRASEIVRISRGEGEWTPLPPAAGVQAPARCVLSLADHKMATKTGRPRRIVMNQRSVHLVDKLLSLSPQPPAWPDLNAYSKAARAAHIGFPPKDLRSSGASHLRWAGVPQADVDQLLGHSTPGVGKNYIQEAWPTLLSSADQLAVIYETATRSL